MPEDRVLPDLPTMACDSACLSAACKCVREEGERLRAEVKMQNGWAHDHLREVERLRAALDRAYHRLGQIMRDRTERDKVFAMVTTAQAEILRALDEVERGDT